MDVNPEYKSTNNPGGGKNRYLSYGDDYVEQLTLKRSTIIDRDKSNNS